MTVNEHHAPCRQCQTLVPAGAGWTLGPTGAEDTYCAACRPRPPQRGDHEGWHLTPLASLDFETTGVDPRQDRIVSFGLLSDQGSERVAMVNPGVPIPVLSTDVHGITDAQVAAAQPTTEAVEMIVDWVQDLIDRSVGLVVFNAAYDLTMLRAEAVRWGVHQPDWDRLLVVDPYVIDWGLELGRLGPAKLTNVCDYYGVQIDSAHDAACDARAARDVAYQMGARHPHIGKGSLQHLSQLQREWFAQRAEGWNAEAETPERMADPHGWPLSRG